MPETQSQPASGAPWAESPEAVAAALQTDLLRGLSAAEAQQRLERYGPNWLREAPPRSRLVAFLGQFADWMIGLLAAAALISALSGEWTDAVLIAAIVVANAIIGYVQEQRAEKAVAALKKLSQPKARVWRDGSPQELQASQLVPGDVIELVAGALVPADARLSDAAELQIEESPLTGESLPVDKQVAPLRPETPLPDRTCMVYAGTAVAHGHGRAVVTSTAMATELGKIASLLESTEALQTPLQLRMAALSKRLAVLVIVICAVVFAAGLLRGAARPETLFLMAVSLAVAAIPEGLPAVITIALALGSQRMAARKAIVRQLASVETLGSVDVICSDKTGTLTQNKMAVSELLLLSDTEDDRKSLLTAATLCNDAELSAEGKVLGSATEAAIVKAALDADLDVAHLRGAWPREVEFPFDSKRKRMSTLHRGPGGEAIAYVKGAPEALLARATHVAHGQATRELTPELQADLERREGELTGRGRRVLAVAQRTWTSERPQSADEVERDLTLLGFIGIVDPPRPEAKAAIATCHAAGVRVAMITGDHRQTATAISDDLGLRSAGDEVVDGEELEHMDDQELARRAPQISVYARVSPEHKLRIVRTLHSLGHVVAMTGDGVNDAPALKQADIGVAMGITGTDVSKEAARMVLADDNFATIVAAIEEGRIVYDNIRKFVLYLLTANSSEILVILFSILLGWPVALLPIHLLWINLVTDGLPALALAFERAEPDVMRRPPRRRDESIFAGGLARDVVLFGALMAAVCLGLYGYHLRGPDAALDEADREAYARGIVFFTLAASQLWYVLGLRSLQEPLLRRGLWSNWRLILAVLLGIALQVVVIYFPPLQRLFHTLPIEFGDLAVALGMSFLPLVAVELRKLILLRRDAGNGAKTPRSNAG